MTKLTKFNSLNLVHLQLMHSYKYGCYKPSIRVYEHFIYSPTCSPNGNTLFLFFSIYLNIIQNAITTSYFKLQEMILRNDYIAFGRSNIYSHALDILNQSP